MAQVEGGGSGGRSANTDVNLVPFIDLMSVLITFLLITAVWSQVSMIQLGTSVEGKRSPLDQQPPDPPPKDSDVVLRVDAKEMGFRVVMERETIEIPKVNGEYDSGKLLQLLKQFKQRWPDKVDAKLSVEESLQYDVMIKGMDALLLAGFPQITIPTGGVE